MLPLSVQTFYATAIDMQKVRNIVERGTEQFPLTSLVTEEDKKVVLNMLKLLDPELTKFDCRAALATARKITRAAENNVLTYGGLAQFIDEMDGRIRDELETCYAFTLTAQEAALYDPAEPTASRPYGQKFESTLYDVEECAKCMALGRSTAAVFHAMRVLERGIAAIANCLGIPDPVKPSDRNWGKMLGKIEDAIKAKWPNQADRDSDDGHLFESLHATLSAIRNPWRNKSMHPARKYTEQEAARIVFAVGGFMEELAERCDEQGNPKV